MQYAHQTGEDLLEKVRNSHFSSEIPLIRKALEKNKPLPEHTRTLAIDTASTLTQFGFGKTAVCAALLQFHDLETLKGEFESEILELAHGLQKIERVKAKNRGKLSPESLQKIILALSPDPQIIIIWICKKLVELRFLSEQPKDEQLPLAEDVLNQWVPVIHKLGLHKIRWEIEDLAMKKILPKEYKAIKEYLNDKRNTRQEKMRELVEKLRSALQKAQLEAVVFGRVKNFYRIYKKMNEQKRNLKDIHDLIGARVICNSVNECYETLAVIQNSFKLETQGFDDYIQKPKKTKYQSIHVDLDWKGIPSEIQIRTCEMHKEAEEGVAAHWEYKQYKKDPTFDRHLTIAKQLAEWFDQVHHKSIMDSLNLKFEKNKIFVLTPKSELVELPEKATPVDFAFAVHTELGYKCEKARVNGKIVPLDYQLQNADSVEIITSEKQIPKQHWLTFVQTEKAKQKIRTKLNIVPTKPEKEKKTGIVKATFRKNAQFLPAKCCSPIPGDEIVGHKTTKRKIKIHRIDCPNAQRIPEDERLTLSNASFTQKEFETTLRINVHNQPGVLSEILDAIGKHDTKIISTEAVTHAHSITCRFRIKTKNRKTFEQTAERVQKIKGIIDVQRG